MRTPLFNDNEFLSQDQLNTAAGLVSDSLEDITSALHTPGLIAASSLSFSYSNLTITVDAPLPFMALFSDGTLASANGTVDGSTSSSATVDFSSLVPSTGNVTAYLAAVSGSVAQSPTTTVGPPVGHPDHNPAFSPYTAYSEQQDTLIFSATLTAPDNETTLFIASTVLSAGQTVITTSSTVGQVRAGAILSRNGEVLAADLASGAAATNVGTLGGSLVGTLPNPTLAAGAAASNVGALGGSLVGTLPNPTLASTGATAGTYVNPISITVDSDGRISAISNVDNFDVPGNVTAGGDIVASGTVSGASATSNGNLIPYGQAFQYLAPTASETITLGNTLETEVMPNITAAATFTLEPGSVAGQSVIFYGGADVVTVQSNVTTGSPFFLFPDGSETYSWVIPAGAYPQGIDLVWDGANWRARTFGQEVVAPATQNNAAVQLGQLQNGTESLDITGLTATSAQINGNLTATGSTSLQAVSATTGTFSGEVTVAPATQNNAAVQLGQLTNYYPLEASSSAGGNNTTTSTSVSFTAPCNGILMAVGSINYGNVASAVNISNLYINGNQVAADNTELTRAHSGSVAVTAGTACSAEYLGASQVAFALWLTLIFVPTPGT